MTEEEYNFVRQMEVEHRDVLRRVSNLENSTKYGDIIMLHADVVSICESLRDTISNKKVKSLQALNILDQMQVGFIEILAQLDTLMS